MSPLELTLAAIIIQGMILGFILRDCQRKRDTINRAVNLFFFLPSFVIGGSILGAQLIEIFVRP